MPKSTKQVELLHSQVQLRVHRSLDNEPAHSYSSPRCVSLSFGCHWFSEINAELAAESNTPDGINISRNLESSRGIAKFILSRSNTKPNERGCCTSCTSSRGADILGRIRPSRTQEQSSVQTKLKLGLSVMTGK